MTRIYHRGFQMNKDEDIPLIFPLGSGGPFHRIQCSLGLISDGSTNLGRRVLWSLALTWLPLLLLWLLQPHPAIGTRDVDGMASLLTHIPTYARFLVSLPLLIVSEQTVRPYLERALRHAVTSGVVPYEEKPAFLAILRKALKSQDSRMAELVLLLLAILEALGVALIMRAHVHNSWTLTGAGLSWAGIWYFCVSKPFLQFLIFRWLYRIMIWWKVLHSIAKLKLVIKPAHPDGRGGLGFLGDSIQAFTILGLALSANVAGGVADFVVTEGSTLLGLKGFIIGGTGSILVMLAAPLVFFSRPMVRAKDQALLNYEELAQRYCQAFDDKWHVGRQEAPIAKGLPVPEFSTMTDMNAMVKGVRDMKTLPYTREGLLYLVIAVIAPFLPVLALSLSFEDILNGIFHAILGGVE